MHDISDSVRGFVFEGFSHSRKRNSSLSVLAFQDLSAMVDGLITHVPRCLRRVPIHSWSRSGSHWLASESVQTCSSQGVHC